MCRVPVAAPIGPIDDVAKNDDVPSEVAPSTIIHRAITVAHRNYRALAYAVVVGCYVIGFTEYVYLRLTVLVSSSNGAVRLSRTENGKDGLHYAIGVACFVAIGIFQIICFFGLTLSESLLAVARQRTSAHEVPAAVSLIITTTIQRTFLCYGLCSLIVCMLIFYMLGIEDSVNATASTICTYLFDAFIILYFVCFPLITVVYHPHVHCRKDVNPIFNSPPPSTIIPVLEAPPPPGSLPPPSPPFPPPSPPPSLPPLSSPPIAPPRARRPRLRTITTV